MEARYYICTLIDHPFRLGKRIAPFALQSALDDRQRAGEDVRGWIGLPEGVRRSLIYLDADNCIMSITAEAIDLIEIEKSLIVKRIELSKDVDSQVRSRDDLIRYGALLGDNAETAIRKVCRNVRTDLETFFDRQTDPSVPRGVTRR